MLETGKPRRTIGPERKSMTVSITSTTESTLARETSAKRAKRMVAILDLVGNSEFVPLSELCEALAISPATARRDLAELARKNLLIRRHGGASIPDHSWELPVSLRDIHSPAAKRAIARQAAAQIPTERYVMAISGGTTTAYVARELSARKDLAIVTNSLTVAGLVSDFAGVRVVVTGGFLRPRSLELVGAIAENTFNSINVNVAILGADGVTADAGVTTHDETEARANHTMVSKAPRTIVVADGSKIGRLALAQCCSIQEVHTLITDDSADAEELKRIREKGVEVVAVSLSGRA